MININTTELSEEEKNFLDAAKLGNQEEVSNFISKDTHNESLINFAFMLAANEGNKKIVSILVNAGAKPNILDEEGDTQLIKAVKYNNLEMVKFLVDFVDLNIQDPMGNTAIIWAVQSENIDILGKLIEKGADLDVHGEYGDVALMFAIKKGYIEAVNMLLESGASVYVRGGGDSCATTLTYASYFGNEEIVKALINHAASIEAVDAKGFTPLMVAAREGHVEIVRILMQSGAKLDIKNKSGDTALNCSSKRGHAEIVEILTKALHGSDLLEESDSTAIASASSLAAAGTDSDISSGGGELESVVLGDNSLEISGGASGEA